MQKYIIAFLFLCLHGMARGQTDEGSLYYWFDSEHESLYSCSLSNGQWQQAIDVSHLKVGLHTFYVMTTDEEGRVSSPVMRQFYKIDQSGGDEQFRCLCYVDGEMFCEKAVSAEGGLVSMELDANALSEGLHRIQLQAMTESGIVSGVYNGFFVRVPNEQELEQFLCMCYVDGELYSHEKIAGEGGVLHMDLNAGSLSEGLHRIQLQVMTESGILSGVYNGSFLRVATTEELGKYSCMYAIDDDAESRKACVVDHDGAFHFDLDMSELSDGLHHISYFLSNDKGASSSPKTRFFIKVPEGGNAISQYQYWLNDDFEHQKTVSLPTVQNPLKLITLLPVGSVPLRSSLFHFEVKDGQPIMYGKNDFHVRFFDGAGRFTDVTDRYVDYNVSRKVENVERIQETQRIDGIEENHVKWYQFGAMRGDSVALKCNKACTIQVFSEKGDELLCSKGSESVVYSGTHLHEAGTYYVAVHDVTANNPTNIVLNYQHIDKYCVLEKTPDVVGNMKHSLFIVALKGNGFDKLKTAAVSKNGQILVADSVHSFGYADAKLYFTLPAETLENGKYDLELTYQDNGEIEALSVKEAIRIVEAEAKDIELTFSEPSTNRSPFTVSIHLKNKGNVGYTYLPINIAFDHIDNISDLRFMDFWAGVSNEADSLGYCFMTITDDLIGKGIRGGMLFFFIPRIEAGEERVLTFKITASISQFDMYAWTGTPLEFSEAVHRQNISIRRANQAHETASCILSFGEHIENLTGEFDNRQVNLLGQVANTTMKAGVALAAVYNGVGNYVHEEQIKAYNLSDDDAEILRSTNPRVATLGEIVGGNLGEWIDMAMGVQRESSRCNPNDNNGGTSTTPGNNNSNCHHVRTRVPVDPNDIIGYIAESGSKAIKSGVDIVNYTIEFENDSEFATASAHEIYLTDTLDATKFNLSSFAPTRVKIGEKSAELTVDKNFVTTIDMRPEINAIAQVEGTYDEKKGIAKWHITSLDPMTMEPTDDVMQGVLPVNTNGQGIGEVSYDISLKPNLAHGTEISNRAGIVFDQNEVIMTPTWTNIIDRIAPECHIKDVTILSDTTAAVSIEGSDDGSGLWRYDVFVQYGSGAWFLAAENVPADTTATVKIYEGIEHHFYAVATDMAGNVEQKMPAWEFSLEPSAAKKGDANRDGMVNVSDVTAIINHILGKKPNVFNVQAADVNNDGVINVTDVTGTINIILNK